VALRKHFWMRGKSKTYLYFHRLKPIYEDVCSGTLCVFSFSATFEDIKLNMGRAVRTNILRKNVEVGNRLKRLGTSRDWLVEVAEAMAAAGSECTENDPSGARGWRRWQMGTRRNREVHLATGFWRRDEIDQVPSIVNDELRIRMVVCNTDDGTCISGREPKNRSKRGPATDRAVSSNQGSFWEYGTLEDKVVALRKSDPESSDYQTWHLCAYHEGDELRAELSFFVETSAGFFEKTRERIFLLGGEFEPSEPVKKKKPDLDADFDIPVSRKK